MARTIVFACVALRRNCNANDKGRTNNNKLTENNWHFSFFDTGISSQVRLQPSGGNGNTEKFPKFPVFRHR